MNAGKAYEPEDPFAMMAAGYPVSDPEVADREMARCFIEEYALLGWSAARIRRLFRSGFFAGTHGVFLRRGPAFVDGLVDEVFGTRAGAPSSDGERED